VSRAHRTDAALCRDACPARYSDAAHLLLTGLRALFPNLDIVTTLRVVPRGPECLWFDPARSWEQVRASRGFLRLPKVIWYDLLAAHG
jgi:hypothetical protein